MRYSNLKKKPVGLSAVIAAMLLVWNCSLDERFSIDSGCSLSFSADTIRLDTVFTGVSSASQCFMVYNRNSSGIRLDAVLAGGMDSPFRINVDGQGGSSITDLEIPGGDSLFCFVSVNIPESGVTGIFKAFDSIRFVLENGNVQFVRLSAYGQNAEKLKGKRIDRDTLLTARLPYLIYDSLYVAQGATLTLAPGTRLYFHSKAVLDVAGRIVAQGNADSVIIMRGDRLDVMQTEPPIAYDLVAAQWGGIRIRSGSYSNMFSYCDIHSAEFGISADSASPDKTKFCLYSSMIHNMDLNCIESTGCRIEVANSLIANAGLSCVDIAGGVSEFNFCTIAGFSLWSLGTQAVLVSDKRDGADVPFAGTSFTNCIITGRHSDELVLSLSDTVKGKARYYIGNSLVMSTDTLNSNFKEVVFDSHERESGGAGNFKGRGREGLRSVYLLDSLSLARGIADSLSVIWPVDLEGVPRPPRGADAGCYQYVKDR